MRHFAVRRFARLALYATLARCALACSADSDHGPPIGAPEGPIGPIVAEGGTFSGAGNGGQAAANTNSGAAANGTAGGAFGTVDTAGAGPFGNGGNGNAFGSGGTGTGSDPFGVAGTPSASSGTSFF